MESRACSTTFILVVAMVLLAATSVCATPVELKFTGTSAMYDGSYHFSGSILYDTESFVNDSYAVTPATFGSSLFYVGHSSYLQSAPSASIFRIESSDLDGFDVDRFNSALNFVNRVEISTDADGIPCSSITFQSVSDQFSLILQNIHMEVHAFAYAADKSIYDLPTCETPFWTCLADYSEYYYSFQHNAFEDAGALDGLTPVPEPGTVVMLGAGLAAMCAFSRRRRT